MSGTNAFKGIALACALAVGSACAGVKKTTTDLNPSVSRPSTRGRDSGLQQPS